MIEKLTPEQDAEIPITIEKWTKIGLSTSPLEVEVFRQQVQGVYKELNDSAPQHTIVGASPLFGCVAAHLVEDVFPTSYDTNYRQHLDSFTDEEIESAVYALVQKVAAEIVGEILGKPPVVYPVSDIKQSKKFQDAWAKIEVDMYKEFLDKGKDKEAIKSKIFFACYGQHDAHWLSYYDFFGSVCNIQEVSKLHPFMRIAESCGWWWPYKRSAIVTDKTECVHMIENNRLHCTDGPAIKYRDGLSVYAVRGVTVPEWIIESPETMTVASIDNETNVEVRRVMMGIFGEGRYLLESESHLVDEDPEFGKLYRKDVREDEDLVMLKVVNSTPEGRWVPKDRHDDDDTAHMLTSAGVKTIGWDLDRYKFIPELDDNGQLIFKDYFLRVPQTIESARQASAWLSHSDSPDTFSQEIEA